MPSSTGVQEQLAALNPPLVEEYPLSEIGVFGSYARDEQRPDSDLDVVVTFDQPVTLFDLVRLENTLTKRLGVHVDLATSDSLKPRIESRITDDIVYV